MPSRTKKQPKKGKKNPSKLFNPQRLSSFLFILGLSIVLASFLWSDYQRHILSFNQPVEANQQVLGVESNMPNRVVISKQEINLEVKPAEIKNNVWQINEDGASHLSVSGYPGQKGNIVIYAHNKKNLFGKLVNLKVGDRVEVQTAGGKTYTYEVQKTKVVNPNQVEILKPTEDETLTLYTCTGVLDSQRFVVQAKAI